MCYGLRARSECRRLSRASHSLGTEARPTMRPILLGSKIVVLDCSSGLARSSSTPSVNDSERACSAAHTHG